MTKKPFEFDKKADQFYSSLAVGVTVHDSQSGDIYYANEYAEEVYGYNEAKLRNKNIIDISADTLSKSAFTKRIQAAANGQPQQFEWRIKRPSGEIFWIEMRLSELSIENQSYVVAIIRNISEYKMNIRHFNLLNRIVRHNFRNKLQIVRGSFTEIDRQTDENKLFNQMRRAITDLVNLTSWVNTLTSLNREKKKRKVNICEILSNQVDDYESKYPKINWKIDCENVYIDASPLLQKAFDELIDNAVRHNSHDNLTITITASENAADQQIDIQIIDTGQPIPEIEIQPLLKRDEPSQLQHGDNIGLWEVQTIVNNHQGILRLKENSTARKVIEVTLPLADPR